MSGWPTYAWVALAGALGALARVGVGRVLPGAAGTQLVNIVGALTFGLVWSWSRDWVHAAFWRTVLLGGFCGALTTFSTWVFEVVTRAETSGPVMAGVSLAWQVGVGLLAMWIGLTLGRLLGT